VVLKTIAIMKNLVNTFWFVLYDHFDRVRASFESSCCLVMCGITKINVIHLIKKHMPLKIKCSPSSYGIYLLRQIMLYAAFLHNSIVQHIHSSMQSWLNLTWHQKRIQPQEFFLSYSFHLHGNQNKTDQLVVKLNKNCEGKLKI